METRQNNFLDMVLSVKTVMDGNRALWASKKPARESYDFTAGNAANLVAVYAAVVNSPRAATSVAAK